MPFLRISKRTRDFIDAADVSGNIRNNKAIVAYLNLIDEALIKAGITTGAVYPFVGGNATSHSFNFLNPSQHQIIWSGTLIHNQNGVKGDGSTGAGDVPTLLMNSLTSNNTSISYYNNFASTEALNGVVGFETAVVVGVQVQFFIGSFNNIMISRQYNISNQVSVSNIPTQIGHFMGNRESNINHSLVRNGNTIGTNNLSNTSLVNGTTAFRILKDANAVFSNKRLSFAHVGNSTTIPTAFSHDIYVAQRSLGRA